MKISYIGDERAKMSKKRWRGNPEINNNKGKNHYHPKQRGTKGNIAIIRAESLRSSSRGGNYPATGRERQGHRAEELQPAMLPEVERVKEKHPDFSLPITIQFPNSTSIWPKPAQSQGILESRKCSLHESDRAVQGMDYERKWRQSGSTLDDLPPRKLTASLP